MDSDNDGLTDGFESASGTLEPAAQAGVPGGAALAPGGFGAEGGFGRGGRRSAGRRPAGTGAPGTGMDPLDVHDH